MLLEVQNLRVCYGQVEAVQGVSLELAEGTVVTIIGSNGAGKSTILRTLSGLQRPSAGEIRFEGKRIDGLRAHEVAKLGIAHVLEGRRLFPALSVIQNLRLGAYLRTDKKEVQETLEQLLVRFPRLKERTNQACGTLSGGEQQMVAICRALMANPKLLLLDEPSLGLSPVLVGYIADIINTIKRDKVSILLVEQNARMALELADNAYVLETGRMALSGSAADMLHNKDVVKAYLGSVE